MGVLILSKEPLIRVNLLFTPIVNHGKDLMFALYRLKLDHAEQQFLDISLMKSLANVKCSCMEAAVEMETILKI